MSRKKVCTTVYITREQDRRLKVLSERTHVAVAEYIRQGIDQVLDSRLAEMPGQLSLFVDDDDDDDNDNDAPPEGGAREVT